MKTAYEIAYKTFSEMDDFSQSIINQGLLVDCVQAGMNSVKPMLQTLYDEMEEKRCNHHDAPGHSHRVAGRWDYDGSVCLRCKAWDELKDFIGVNAEITGQTDKGCSVDSLVEKFVVKADCRFMTKSYCTFDISKASVFKSKSAAQAQITRRINLGESGWIGSKVVNAEVTDAVPSNDLLTSKGESNE